MALKHHAYFLSDENLIWNKKSSDYLLRQKAAYEKKGSNQPEQNDYWSSYGAFEPTAIE